MDEILIVLKENSALIISVVAILLTIQQGWTTRKHNRVTVRPRLTTSVDTDILPSNPNVVLYKGTLHNYGLGSAYIDSFEFLIDGKPIASSNPKEVYESIKSSTKLQLVEDMWKIGIMRKEHVMGKDTSILLVQLAYIKNESLAEESKRFHVRVVYKSAYGERFVYDSRDHD